ncbi:MAG: hypothetical protein ACP5G0_08215 [Desulfomonilia bacterium]
MDTQRQKKQRELFALLVETASNAGIEIIEDAIHRRGGVCRLKGRIVVVFDSHATYRERNRLILDAISRINPDCIYLPPKVRQILEQRSGYTGSPDARGSNTPGSSP